MLWRLLVVDKSASVFRSQTRSPSASSGTPGLLVTGAALKRLQKGLKRVKTDEISCLKGMFFFDYFCLFLLYNVRSKHR